jgi:hypothetical protein
VGRPREADQLARCGSASALAAEYGVDELVVVTITHDPKARLRSYELLAQAFGLEPRGGDDP